MTENRQYQEMLEGARSRMQGMDLFAAAEKAGLAYDREAGHIRLISFGQESLLQVKSLETDPPMEMWHHLAILQYLEGADGRHPSEVWIGMSDLSDGGLVRGASFDREIDSLIAGRLGKCDPDKVRQACSRLGALFQKSSRADLCADFLFMPRFPLRLQVWEADDDFPASGKVLIDQAAGRCLGTEAIGTIAGLLVRELCDLCGV